MAFLDTLGAEIKASFKRIPFSSVGGGGFQANNALANWNGSMLGNRQPGATLNYDELAGDPLDNRVVAACIEAISSALPEAPPVLEKRKGDDWERIPDHPVLDLLHRPNKYHTTYHLWNATIGSELTAGDGSAYWQVVMNDAGSAPVELWFEPRVKVLWNAKEFISGYQLERDGKWIDVKNDQIIHFRNSLNPYNTRLGRNALSAGKRQITGDNAAATYHSALLRNSAVASLLVTLKDGGTNTLTPEQLNEYMERLTNKLRGEGAGKIAGSNLPIDVHKLAYSPDEMSLDKLIAYYEVTLCALIKVPPMVIGLGGGNSGKTYSNYAEAIRDFWMRTIIPAQNKRGMEITTQLLPLFGLDASQHRISFDYSNVAALTEDDNPLMDVLVKVCGGAFMTKNEARSRLKMEPLPEGGDEVGTPPEAPAPEEGKAPPKVEAKSWDESQHHRADDGKFGSGTSSTRTPAFKAWFGASKVIDSNGAPQVNHGVSAPAVVYHGVANVTSDGDAWGMVFTPHRADAESNGDEPMAAYLSIQKPFSMSVLELHNSAHKAESVIKDLQRKGFDGLHVQTGDYQEWIAFNPTQVKAVDASHFDASDPNPYKAMTNEPKADELPAWTPEELDAMSEEFTEDDIKHALATSDEPLRELLKAKDGN